MNYILGILSPAAIFIACVYEFMARRMVKDPRHDKKLLEKRQKTADIALAAAWLLLGAAYLVGNSSGNAAFEAMMTWALLALLVLDVVYLYLRRSRPRPAGKKKHFWEI